jgi:hypothetical protein
MIAQDIKTYSDLVQTVPDLEIPDLKKRYFLIPNHEMMSLLIELMDKYFLDKVCNVSLADFGSVNIFFKF